LYLAKTTICPMISQIGLLSVSPDFPCQTGFMLRPLRLLSATARVVGHTFST
jgi:hypothetical protein